MPYPVTPDGRYFVVRGRLWRCTDPALPPEERDRGLTVDDSGRFVLATYPGTGEDPKRAAADVSRSSEYVRRS